MTAILKRELRAFFYSPIAYVMIGLFVLVSSAWFMIANFYNGYMPNAEIRNVLGFMAFFLMIFTPILTMRIIAEDRKNGTEVLLFTSPVSLVRIVLGKYLATLLVFSYEE